MNISLRPLLCYSTGSTGHARTIRSGAPLIGWDLSPPDEQVDGEQEREDDISCDELQEVIVHVGHLNREPALYGIAECSCSHQQRKPGCNKTCNTDSVRY